MTLSEDAGDDRCGDVLSLDGGDDAGYEFCCMLEAGHGGPHRDEFEGDGRSIVVTWYASNGTMLIADDEHLPLAR